MNSITDITGASFQTTKSTRRQKWFRVSLRSALLIMTVCCLGLGWQAHQRKQQQDALAEIRTLGGQFQTESAEPSRLSHLFSGIRQVSGTKVVAITFLGAAVSDAEVDSVILCLSVLPNLEYVTLTDTAITYTGEQQLRSSLPDLDIQVIRTAWQNSSYQQR